MDKLMMRLQSIFEDMEAIDDLIKNGHYEMAGKVSLQVADRMEYILPDLNKVDEIKILMLRIKKLNAKLTKSVGLNTKNKPSTTNRGLNKLIIQGEYTTDEN